MSTTYTKAEIHWGDKTGRISIADADRKEAFKNAIVTYPTADAPYFSVTMTRSDDTTLVIESQRIVVVRPT